MQSPSFLNKHMQKQKKLTGDNTVIRDWARFVLFFLRFTKTYLCNRQIFLRQRLWP